MRQDLRFYMQEYVHWLMLKDNKWVVMVCLRDD